MKLDKIVKGYKIFNGVKNNKFFTKPNTYSKPFYFDYGEPYHTDDPIKLCESGFHYSPSIYEAAQYKKLITYKNGYAIINPVCRVSNLKSSDIDISLENSAHTYTPSLKVVSSDLVLLDLVPLDSIMDTITIHHRDLLEDNHVKRVDDVTLLNICGEKSYIGKYNIKIDMNDIQSIIYLLTSDSQYHVVIDKNNNKVPFYAGRNTTLFLNGKWNSGGIIENKSPHTVYLNIFSSNTQHIFNIPRYSTINIPNRTKVDELTRQSIKEIYYPFHPTDVECTAMY